MAKKVMQFRYYGPGDSRNAPSGATRNRFVSGSIFNNYYPIKKLGIQTIPGVKFSLNKSMYPITIGHTGIYELELEDKIDIFNLAFEAASMNLIGANESSDSYLIVDIIYDTEEV